MIRLGTLGIPGRAAALALLLGSAAAQVGSPYAALDNNPALANYTRSGSALTSPQGVRLTLSRRGPYLAGVTITLPTFDTATAGQLLGVFTGYGDQLTGPYAQFLADPKVAAQLPAGVSVVAAPYQIVTRQIGKGLSIDLHYQQVPATLFDPTSRALGPAKAAIVLRIFSDFQCPYCEQFETQTWPELQQALGPEVRVEFHHLPLEQLHPNARAAAEASECAAAQGRFWEYKDALFAPQNWALWTKASNPNPAFLALGQTLKLSTDAFGRCLANRDGKAAVDAGLQEAQRASVNSTPTIFVNGYPVGNPYRSDLIMQLIHFVQGK